MVADQEFPTMSFGSGASMPSVRKQPFSILLMGQFGLGAPAIHGLLDRDVQALLADRQPNLQVQLPNLFQGQGNITAEIAFGSLKDLRIERLAQCFAEIELACKLHGDLKKGLAREEVIRRNPEASSWPCVADVVGKEAGNEENMSPADAPENANTPRSEPGKSEDPLDNILSMVADVGVVNTSPSNEGQPSQYGGEMDQVHRALNAFVGHISRDFAPRDVGSWSKQALSGLEHVLAAQLSLLAEHPTMRMLRRNWLMVSFLLKRLGRSGDVRLHLLDSADMSLAQAMRTLLLNRDDLMPEGLGVMIQLEVVDGPAVPSLLSQYAEIAELIQVPLVTSVGEEFLGINDGKLPETPIKEAYRHAWNELRGKPESRWLGVTCNGFCLEDELRLSDISMIAAAHGGITISYPCRGSGAAIVAAILAQCVEATGWPGDVMNTQYAVDGLFMPVDRKTPLLWPLGLGEVRALASSGVMAPGSTQLRDHLFLASAPSLAGQFSDGRDVGAGFVYQLLFRKAVSIIEANYDQLFGLQGVYLCERLSQMMAMYLGDGQVHVAEMQADDGVKGVVIDITFGSSILRGGQIHLELPLA